MDVTDAVSRRSMMPVAICQRVKKAAVPRLTRLEGHLEAEPSVGVYALLDDREGEIVTARVKSPFR
jgi:hypothetical protein